MKKDDRLDYIPDLIKQLKNEKLRCEWSEIDKIDQQIQDLENKIKEGHYYEPKF